VTGRSAGRDLPTSLIRLFVATRACLTEYRNDAGISHAHNGSLDVFCAQFSRIIRVYE
jgi:hypothetical protein